MVGVKGLEPSTSRSQTARASQLRHTPIVYCNRGIVAKDAQKVKHYASARAAIVVLNHLLLGWIGWMLLERARPALDITGSYVGDKHRYA